MWWEPARGPVFRSLLSHVDVEGELESPTMSQGEPLPRPFLHHSQCLLYRGLSGDNAHPVVAILEVLRWAVNIWLYFWRTSFLCWCWPKINCLFPDLFDLRCCINGASKRSLSVWKVGKYDLVSYISWAPLSRNSPEFTAQYSPLSQPGDELENYWDWKFDHITWSSTADVVSQ